MELSAPNIAVEKQLAQNLRRNLIVNLFDGGFFGLGLGFASFVTVLPLFVSSLTDSAVLIGLIPAIHAMGWQLPQLLTAHRVARLRRFKPMVLLMTIHERVPFLGLAFVAWFLPFLSREAALFLTFLFLTWQGLGGGVTATAWQAMIGKIIPARQRGTFFGTQSAAANLFASAGAIAAGFLLQNLAAPAGYAVCFLLTSLAMTVSWFFLAGTVEPEHAPTEVPSQSHLFWKSVIAILQRDASFRWFLIARMLSQFAIVAFAFYIVYAVRFYVISKEFAGILTGALFIAQVVSNPLVGWIGDHRSHRTVMELGALAAAGSAAVAWMATGAAWFFPVFLLAGVSNAALWTASLSMTVEFGTPADRPAYIGLANTLVAPSTILAPIVGGWLADAAGFPIVFVISFLGGLATVFVLQMLVEDPRRHLALE